MARRLRLFLRRTYGGLPGLTWLICAAAFVNRAGSMVVPFLSLYLGKRYGMSVEDAGYVAALFGVGSIVGSVGGGRLTDAFGPVRTQIVTLLASGLWMAGLTLVESKYWFAAGILVLGALNDAFRPGNVAAVAASAPRYRQAKALALNRFALNAGWAIGPAVGGLLAQFDFRLLFLADGLTCVLAALLLWRCVPRRLGIHRAHTQRAAAVDGARVSPWTDGRFLFLLLLSTLAFLVFLQQLQTLTRHLSLVLHYDEGDVGRLLILNPALIVLFEMPFVQALRHHARLPLVVAGTACIGLCYPFLVLQSWGTTAVILCVLTATLGEMLYMPALAAYVSERAPAARGNYLGAYFATFSLGFMLAPAAGGVVYERLGADALWWTCTALGLLIAAGVWWLHTTEPHAGQHREPSERAR